MTTIRKWEPSTSYEVGEIIEFPDEIRCRVLIPFVSGAIAPLAYTSYGRLLGSPHALDGDEEYSSAEASRDDRDGISEEEA